jgi:hypothetical protein
MHFNASAAGYSVNRVYYPKIGLFMEDFETGTFTKYDWLQEGDLPWVVDHIYPYEGYYQAKSGTITDNQTSEFYITYTVMEADTIKFWRKVSSEADFDKLIFKIDNTIKGTWSGSKSWAQIKFPVSAGTHTFRWIYEKDYAGSAGSDCAWIDNIELPTMMVSTVFAGPDDQSCANVGYQCNGASSNFSTLQWVTAGDGTFNFDNVMYPVYTPGDNDILNGMVELTLNMTDVAGNQFADAMDLTISTGPESPSVPTGPNYIDVYKTTQTQHNTEAVAGATDYIWSLTPQEAGTIANVGTIVLIDWNPDYLGEALLSVSASDECGIGQPSGAQVIFVDNTVGLGEQANQNVVISTTPNPNNGEFILEIKTTHKEPINMKMLNTTGIVVAEKTNINSSEFTMQMELNNLPTGVYIIKVEQGNHLYTRKVLLTK